MSTAIVMLALGLAYLGYHVGSLRGRVDSLERRANHQTVTQAAHNATLDILIAALGEES